MKSLASLSLLALMSVLTAGTAGAADSHTTRIVTTPAYGAVVTVEHGVRVYRPLPSENHVIVNPRGATPLGLNFYTPSTGTGAPLPVSPVDPR